jgi:hypothetical protein
MKKKPAWLSILPPGAAEMTLDELRNVKKLHEFLTQPVPGPAPIAEFIRGFHYLLLFGAACVAENKHPALKKAWQELDRLFMSDPSFDDPEFVPCWLLMDFPFGPEGQTALDYFEDFLGNSESAARFKPFIKEARRSRLGLYQDVMRSKTVAKFRELFTGNVISAFPSVDHYENGEILLARMMEADGITFVFGDPKGFPKEAKESIETMIEDKFFYLIDEPTTKAQMYETFMRLAGPYWMSCVTKKESVPILDPDHYRNYLG